MASSLRPVRILVWSTALLLTTVALAGCHDLPNTFSDDGLDPADDPGEDVSGDDEAETGGGEQDTGGNGDGGNGGDDGSDGPEDDGGAGGNDGDDGDDGDDSQDEEEDGGTEDDNGTDEEDPPEIERGDYEADETIEIHASSEAAGFCGSDDFEPEELTIKVGDAVNWRYEGPQSHTVHNDCFGHTAKFTDQEGEEHETDHMDEDDESDTFRFNQAGVYEYECGYHPDMTGTITVEE